MIDLIKSIFGVPKKNGIYIIVISLALQLCLIDRDFKYKIFSFLLGYLILKVTSWSSFSLFILLPP